jgi:signal transduction histidine kinase
MPFARWLAILILLLMLTPATAGAIGWVIARDVQNSQQGSLARAAKHALAHPHPLNRVWLADAVARLQGLGVSAHLEPTYGNQPTGAPSVPSRKNKHSAAGTDQQANLQQQPAGSGDVATRNFKPADAPTATNASRYRQIEVTEPHLAAILLIPRGNPTVAWLVAVASGLATLLAAIIAASAAIRRWIARPLVQLAGGAEQIAAGDLEINRVLSPIREIAVVGDAQHGMTCSLADALQAARAADRERRFLITAIAHDLRTPLFTLRGSLEALELGISGQQALQRAQQKASHLDRLVNDLFTFSRLEYAREPQHQRPFDVRDTAQNAVDSVAVLPAADTRTVAMDRPDTPIILHSDETAVARILTNLLDNAIRHARGQVQLRIQQLGDHVALEISDDGPGFAPDTLPRIFDPFYQADSARSSNGGAGLGLTIVHRLATALGGTVTASNRADNGALVVVTLPSTAPATHTPPMPLTEAPTPSSSAQSAAPRLPMRAHRTL